MIYTLTMNPAIDMNIVGKDIKPNIVNRTKNVIYSANGKGINVALVLQHFGVAAVAVGFFGGFTGKYILTELKKRQLETMPIFIDGTTRINIFLNDGANEYKFVNEGAAISLDKQKEFIDKFRQLRNCEYLVISGSMPSNIDERYYEDILQVCREKKIEVILDISSKKLENLLLYHPLLIKPNDEEVKDIFGVAIHSDEDAYEAVRMLHYAGTKNVLLTLGARGSYFSDGTNLYKCGVQPIKLLSSACAGDAALGAFLSEWLFNGDIATALKKSAATGANAAEGEAIGDFVHVNDYMKNIKVQKLKAMKI